jgi:peptide-methionine (S)-S-oxide reductase
MAIETAVLGGGCFWCLDAVFREVEGVRSVVSGYAGGARPHPTYEQICTGATGHAEVVKLEFDTRLISFSQILSIFFSIHDPTTLNRQGNDVGTQYRSVVFCQSDEQENKLRDVIGELAATGAYHGTIVTEISGPVPFYPAEDYHQNYYAMHPGQGYCQLVISPKLTKFRQKFLR